MHEEMEEVPNGIKAWYLGLGAILAPKTLGEAIGGGAWSEAYSCYFCTLRTSRHKEQERI